MPDNTSLTKPIKMGSSLKKGIAANRANFTEQMKSVDPNTVPNRIGMVLDDSASMGFDGMENAHKAVKGFTNNCNPLDTSIAIYPMNKEPKQLICDYDLVNLYVCGIWSSGGTPAYQTLKSMYTKEKLTRAVLFSDGDPADSSVLADDKKESNEDFWYGKRDNSLAMEVVGLSRELKAPIDTIFIGDAETKGYREMKKLAELTDGTFIHFKDASSLSTGLKYLAPKYRALLADPNMKKRIEAGENV